MLDYSTYLGGKSADRAHAIAVDALGALYLAGLTASLNFPTTTTPFQSTFHRGQQDVFVTKLDPTTSTLVYSTYLGGASKEWAAGIAVDSGGIAYVTGVTSSRDFPITFGAFQTVLRGDEDIFVIKLNSTGSGLVYSTYIGGSCTKGASTSEYSGGIAINQAGNAYIAGTTTCHDFPTTIGGFQIGYNGGASDAVVVKLNPFGNGLEYSTYLGGSRGIWQWDCARYGHKRLCHRKHRLSEISDNGRCVEPTHPGGNDAFVTKLNATGSAPVYSTYLGGRRSGQSIFGQSSLASTGLKRLQLTP